MYFGSGITGSWQLFEAHLDAALWRELIVNKLCFLLWPEFRELEGVAVSRFVTLNVWIFIGAGVSTPRFFCVCVVVCLAVPKRKTCAHCWLEGTICMLVKVFGRYSLFLKTGPPTVYIWGVVELRFAPSVSTREHERSLTSRADSWWKRIQHCYVVSKY